MAIKISNQITFTEHKKIVEIKEWYLATNQDANVTIGTEGWTTNIQTITATKKYLWNYEETIYSLGSSDVTSPVIIGVYGETGSVGASLQIKYIKSSTTPVIVDNDVSAWSDTVPIPEDDERVYMTQKLSTDVNWSTPIPISAIDGKNGSANVEINDDGYWVINGEITGVKAEGEAGKAPEITIGQNGNWYIDGVDSGTKAQGEAGKDGSDVEYVYYRSENEVQLSAPSYNADGTLTTGWDASPQGITETYKCEYVSVRTKPLDGDWGNFSTPVLWSRWGEKGQDGDGVEYKYYLSNSSTIPSYSSGDSKWTDDPSGVTKDNQYEYVVQIKTSNGETTISKPSLWAKYGENGVGISEIVNYYQVTQNTNVPTSWQDSMDGLELSPTNKYLWNYEEIIYTDGSSITTDPAIIGAYGDSGTDVVDFQIYSVDGFEFNDNLTSITLKTVAMQSGQSIEANVTYQWKWYNADSESEDKYENITNATASSLIVNFSDSYSLNSIRCDMTYNGITYSDYIILTFKSAVYTSVIKFFNGSNAFDPEKTYIAAYVEVYKNNILDETKFAEKYYDGKNTILDNSTIETDVSTVYPDRVFEENEKMYFIHRDGNNKYTATIGQYVGGTWTVYTPANKYTYANNFSENKTSNVIVISRQDIARSAEMNIAVYQGDTFVSRCNATVIDTNDPIISDVAPTNVKYGQLWLDTSTTPYVLKIYTKSKSQYILEDVEVLQIYYAKDKTITSTLSYGDNISIYDDEAIKLNNKIDVTFSYDTYEDANVIAGKFITYANAYYYIPENVKVTRKVELSPLAYTASVPEAQKVITDRNMLGEWVYFSQQNGGTVYTSIPLDGYTKGDLWIISEEDAYMYVDTYSSLFNKFGAGTMLKATASSDVFDEAHWIDSMEELSSVVQNVKQYFEFNTDTGLKIGRKDESFYVNIDATEMAFYDNTGDSPQKVVYISNSTANIDNVLIEGSAEFDCETTFNKKMNIRNETASSSFSWQIEESNGSFSLVLG